MSQEQKDRLPLSEVDSHLQLLDETYGALWNVYREESKGSIMDHRVLRERCGFYGQKFTAYWQEKETGYQAAKREGRLDENGFWKVNNNGEEIDVTERLEEGGRVYYTIRRERKGGLDEVRIPSSDIVSGKPWSSRDVYISSQYIQDIQAQRGPILDSRLNYEVVITDGGVEMISRESIITRGTRNGHLSFSEGHKEMIAW